MQPYSTLLESIGSEYGIPLTFRQGVRLEQNPAVISIMTLLNLALDDFPRQAVLDVLRSPYFNLDMVLSTEDIDALERVSLAFKVMGSMDEWFYALEQATRVLL